MKKTILHAAALTFALALAGVISCQSQGAQTGGGGGGCGGAPATDDSSCNARCGYGTYQYKCECRADPKYQQSVNQQNSNNAAGANNNGSSGSAGQGVSH